MHFEPKTSFVRYCLELTEPYLFSFPVFRRNPSQSYPNHGQAGPRSVHAVQAGDRKGRPRRGYQ